MSVTRHGVRYSKVESRGSRWGGPKVHYAVWHKSAQEWQPLCMLRLDFFGYGYPTVDDDVPATCKKCLAKRDTL